MRTDLYYRLCGHHIEIPPLRQRQQDIPYSSTISWNSSPGDGQKQTDGAQGTAPVTGQLPFPGNIRELKGMVFDAMSLHKTKMLSMDAFKRAIDKQPLHSQGSAKTVPASTFVADAPLPQLNEWPTC